MLEEVNIKNLAVIEDTTLHFESKETALVGETGAGKSLVVDSLSLLSGERADSSLVRDTSKKATVSARFSLTDAFLKKHPEIQEYAEGKELLLRRSIFPDRSSRCYLNDEPVSLNEFRRVTSHLIDIHSQNSRSDILDEDKQLLYVDAYGKEKLEKAKEEFQKAYAFYQQKEKEKKELIEENAQLDEEYLTFQIKEIEKYHLKDNEIEDLNEEYESLRDYEKIKEKYETYRSSLSGKDEDLFSFLGHAITRLNTFKGTSLEEDANHAKEECEKALNALTSLEEDFKALNADPQRIDAINERLFELKGLQRKYGKTTKDIQNKLKEYKSKLAFSHSFEEKKKEKEEEVKKAYETAKEKALILSQLRKESAKKLDEKIGVEMASLGLRKGAFKTSFKETELTSSGLEKVSFEVALNEGLGYASLAKAASGGESSRLMLALKCVLNSLDPYDVLIFDEIDTGVSGKQASLIAKRIRSLTLDSQIIVISHLPQVVASALSSILIQKTNQDGKALTQASSLNQKEQVSFVAKMLSGKEVTESALNQAKELMEEFSKP